MIHYNKYSFELAWSDPYWRILIEFIFFCRLLNPACGSVHKFKPAKKKKEKKKTRPIFLHYYMALSHKDWELPNLRI